MDENVDSLVDSGILTPESGENLKQYIYAPRAYLDYLDPEGPSINVKGRPISISSSGIDRLKEGSDTDYLLSDYRFLMNQAIARAQSRIFRNNANKAGWELATQEPENGIFRKAKKIRVEKTTGIDPADLTWEETPMDMDLTAEAPPKKVYYTWEKPKPDESPITVMIDGKPQRMFMPTKLAREWVNSDPGVSRGVANLFQWLSGTKVVKALATGYNPAFALVNIPMDIGLQFMQPGPYSSFLPKMLIQVAKNYREVAGDALRKTGKTKEYILQGGDMNWLSYQGRFNPRSTNPTWEAINRYGTVIQNWSELLGRTGLKVQAEKMGQTPHEATHTARNYLDFNQGGSMVRALDNGYPYLRATVNATRSLGRAARKNPPLFMWKMAQLGFLSMGVILVVANDVSRSLRANSLISKGS